MSSEIIEIGGFVIVVGGIIWNYAFSQGRDKQLEDNINRKIDEHIVDDGKVEVELKREIEAMWKWKDAHERDAANMREKYQSALSELKGEQRVFGEQFKQIMGGITEIKDRLTTLENGK